MPSQSSSSSPARMGHGSGSGGMSVDHTVAVGRRFACCVGGSSRDDLEKLSWKSGIIRAATEVELTHEEQQFCVEWDGKDPIRDYQWIYLHDTPEEDRYDNVSGGNYSCFLLEDRLMWCDTDRPSNGHSSTSNARHAKQLHSVSSRVFRPVLTLMPLVDKIGFSSRDRLPVHLLAENSLAFVEKEQTSAFPVQQHQTSLMINGEAIPVSKDHQIAINHWFDLRLYQKKLIYEKDKHLIGQSVMVYWKDGASQRWYSACLKGYSKKDKDHTVVVMDYNVTQDRKVDPRLEEIQMVKDHGRSLATATSVSPTPRENVGDRRSRREGAGRNKAREESVSTSEASQIRKKPDRKPNLQPKEEPKMPAKGASKTPSKSQQKGEPASTGVPKVKPKIIMKLAKEPVAAYAKPSGAKRGRKPKNAFASTPIPEAESPPEYTPPSPPHPSPTKRAHAATKSQPDSDTGVPVVKRPRGRPPNKKPLEAPAPAPRPAQPPLVSQPPPPIRLPPTASASKPPTGAKRGRPRKNVPTLPPQEEIVGSEDEELPLAIPTSVDDSDEEEQSWALSKFSSEKKMKSMVRPPPPPVALSAAVAVPPPASSAAVLPPRKKSKTSLPAAAPPPPPVPVAVLPLKKRAPAGKRKAVSDVSADEEEGGESQEEEEDEGTGTSVSGNSTSRTKRPISRPTKGLISGRGRGRGRGRPRRADVEEPVKASRIQAPPTPEPVSQPALTSSKRARIPSARSRKVYVSYHETSDEDAALEEAEPMAIPPAIKGRAGVQKEQKEKEKPMISPTEEKVAPPPKEVSPPPLSAAVPPTPIPATVPEVVSGKKKRKEKKDKLEDMKQTAAVMPTVADYAEPIKPLVTVDEPPPVIKSVHTEKPRSAISLEAPNLAALKSALAAAPPPSAGSVAAPAPLPVTTSQVQNTWPHSAVKTSSAMQDAPAPLMTPTSIPTSTPTPKKMARVAAQPQGVPADYSRVASSLIHPSSGQLHPESHRSSADHPAASVQPFATPPNPTVIPATPSVPSTNSNLHTLPQQTQPLDYYQQPPMRYQNPSYHSHPQYTYPSQTAAQVQSQTTQSSQSQPHSQAHAHSRNQHHPGHGHTQGSSNISPSPSPFRATTPSPFVPRNSPANNPQGSSNQQTPQGSQSHSQSVSQSVSAPTSNVQPHYRSSGTSSPYNPHQTSSQQQSQPPQQQYAQAQTMMPAYGGPAFFYPSHMGAAGGFPGASGTIMYGSPTAGGGVAPMFNMQAGQWDPLLYPLMSGVPPQMRSPEDQYRMAQAAVVQAAAAQAASNRANLRSTATSPDLRPSSANPLTGVITGAMQALNNFQIPSPPLTCSPFQQPSFPNTKQQTSSPSPALSSANDSSRNRNLNLESHYGTESPKSAPSPRHFQTPPSTSAQMADYERFAKMADFSGMPAAPARNQPPTAITPRTQPMESQADMWQSKAPPKEKRPRKNSKAGVAAAAASADSSVGSSAEKEAKPKGRKRGPKKQVAVAATTTTAANSQLPVLGEPCPLTMLSSIATSMIPVDTLPSSFSRPTAVLAVGAPVAIPLPIVEEPETEPAEDVADAPPSDVPTMVVVQEEVMDIAIMSPFAASSSVTEQLRIDGDEMDGMGSNEEGDQEQEQEQEEEEEEEQRAPMSQMMNPSQTSVTVTASLEIKQCVSLCCEEDVVMAYISNPRKASLERMHHVGEPPISMGGTRVFALLDHTIPHQIQKPDRRNKRKAREMDLENYMMKKRQEAMKSGDKARGPPRRAEASGVPPIPKMQMEEPRSFVQNKDCILWRYFQCVVRKDLVIDIPLCLDCFVLDVEGKKFYGERPDENDELSTCRFKGSNMRQLKCREFGVMDVTSLTTEDSSDTTPLGPLGPLYFPLVAASPTEHLNQEVVDDLSDRTGRDGAQMIASYILPYAIPALEKVLQEEEEFATADQMRGATLKKLPPMVRESCDVCSTSIFNVHHVCSFCGFAVCGECKKERALATNANGRDKRVHLDPYAITTFFNGINGKEVPRDGFNWQACCSNPRKPFPTKQPLRDISGIRFPHHLKPTRIIPSNGTTRMWDPQKCGLQNRGTSWGGDAYSCIRKIYRVLTCLKLCAQDQWMLFFTRNGYMKNVG